MLDIEDLFKEEADEKYIEPDRIFSSLIKNPEYEYLRSIQSEILDKWFKSRSRKDNIVKMNTGGGKTLVGLLMLQSSLNEGISPAIYLCPDYQLVEQVMKSADDYGIKCTTDAGDIDFYNGDAILVTVFDKVFNGQSKFEKQGVHFGCILLDDAHTCINKTRSKFTLKIKRNTNEYSQIFNLFKSELENQDMASAAEIEFHQDNDVVMQVPYWCWYDNVKTIIPILSSLAEKGNGSKDDDLKSIFFNWPLIKSTLSSCYCFIESEYIEITPHCIPIEKITSFSEATRRIYMSATLVDDSLLVKELNIDVDAIKNPLVNEKHYNIGERMIIMPPILHESLTTDKIVGIVGNLSKSYNTIILTPSSAEYMVKKWRDNGGEVVNKDNIISKIEELDGSQKKMLILSNRYDGIDLKGEKCRVLVIDGLPKGNTLIDKFTNKIRNKSNIIRMLQAQKIEQGIGRSTRTGSDYSVVLLLGNDIIPFMSIRENKQYLSKQTRQQVNIGIDFSKSAGGKINTENAQEILLQIMDCCLKRDERSSEMWQKYHNNKLQQAKEETNIGLPIEVALAERDAYNLFNSNRPQEAANLLRKMISNHPLLHNQDKGWLFELAATYMYSVSRTESIDLQLKAHECNSGVLKAPVGTRYTKLNKKMTSQAAKALNYIQTFDEGNAYIIHVNNILDKLVFGVPANIFEENMKDLASILGLYAQRPEKEFNDGGPDVLWQVTNDKYFVIECKDEVDITRGVIWKDNEASQLGHSMEWFNQKYENSEAIPVLIHPATKCAHNAYCPEGSRIIDVEMLRKVVDVIKKFAVQIISTKPITELSIQDVDAVLSEHKIRYQDIISNFTKKCQ